MALSFGRGVRVLVCLASLFCASCLSMTVPKGARVEPGSGSSSGGAPADKRLVDTWELLYQVNDKGEKDLPKEGTRTLIEFTDKGRVIFNRIDKDNPSKVGNRTGQYTQENNQIVLADDGANKATWTYTVSGDNLVVTAPELNLTFHWRRFR
jgi:hypothetical protein